MQRGRTRPVAASISGHLSMRIRRTLRSLRRESRRVQVRTVGAETSLPILTRERISGLRETDQPFYSDLVRSSITLGGESIENS